MKNHPDFPSFRFKTSSLYSITLKDEEEEKEIDYPVTKDTFINFFGRFDDLWDKRVRFYTTEKINVSGILVGLKST